MTAWREFPWRETPPDHHEERLCIETSDARRPDCRIEGANFASAHPPPTDELVVCAYNVERGLHLDDQIRQFTDGSDVPAPDIFLISEADRGCTRSGNRNVARAYAEAFGMCYVYGVEFIELPRIWGPGGAIRRRCEHGNAIISRYPLGNVRLIRHRDARSWNSLPQRILRIGQPRHGGRVSVAADALIGDRRLRLYAVHFESGWPERRDAYRLSQVTELIADAADVRSGVLIGGDMNVVRYLETSGLDEPTVAALLAAGFQDAHASLEPSERVTTDSGVVIDLIAGRGVRLTDAGIGQRAIWGGLSDHLPVWARVRW